MSRFKLLYFMIFIINLHNLHAQISDKRLCVDKECSVPISYAKTLLRYSSPDSRILSFAPNVDITIYSKSAGSREDLWGGEINGKRGYFPKHMVRETKVLVKPTILVETEFNNNTEAKQVPSQVEPDKVEEIVDGTTIYLNSQDNISPSSTESPIQTTALPLEIDKISTSQIVTESPISVSSKEQEIIKEKLETPQVQEDDKDIKNQSQNNETINEIETITKTIGNEITDEIHSKNDKTSNENNEADLVVVETSSEENIHEKNTEKVEILQTLSPPNESLVEIENETYKTEIDLETNKTPQVTNIEEPKQNENIEETKSEEDKSKDQSEILNAKTKIEAETKKTEEIKVNIESEIKQIPQNTNEEIKSENTDFKKSELTTEQPKTIIADILDTILLPTDNKKIQTNEESTILLDPEVTTLSPEIDIPQPFDDSFIQVTENPAEVVTEVVPNLNPEIPATSLPPLGLFSQSKQQPIIENLAQQENFNSINVESEEERKESGDSQEENVNLDDTKQENEDTQEDDNLDSGQVKEEIVNIEIDDLQSPEDVKSETDDLQLPEDVVKSETENPLPVVNTPTNDDDDDDKKVDEEDQKFQDQNEESSSSGFFNTILSSFSLSSEEDPEKELTSSYASSQEKVIGDELLSKTKEPFCDSTSNMKSELKETVMDFFNFNSDIFLYLVTTAISVIIFLFGYIAFDKSKREGPLVAKINKLEKELLVVFKENQILQEKLTTDSGYETNDKVSSEVVENLKQDLIEITEKKNALEEQVQCLEKELENSTEVGMELNRMLTEILSSEGGSDILKANVENLQRQLVEQQATINSVNETLAITNTENHELKLELELSNKKVLDLQAELDKLLLNILKLEEEKESQQGSLELEIANLRQKYDDINNKFKLKENEYTIEMKQLNNKLEQSERKLELKSKEYNILTETIKQLKALKNDSGAVKNILEVAENKAELQLLKSENERLMEKIQQEQDMKINFEKRAQIAIDELQELKEKYDEADKLKVEIETKLEVLSNYFKDREAQWQKEISKHEALWAEKEGEATSTTERIKFMQEQLQNYKAQTESLKQEIMSQEIELKSQISVLEKKAHENWVSTRQAERKLEDAKQEAAQLRHRLTLRERALQEDKNQHRLQSPIEQNGEMPESPSSPPLLYGTRDHITKSPPLPGLPPFLPPPPGLPFMPPPLHGVHGVPPFIPPPPPNMFPGDHRPPPLGRMSSPPLNSRYSPTSRGYSPYDRNSSSPSDSEYGTSPPYHRGYSPFNSREDGRDYKRPPPGRSNGRNLMKGGSSGSGHSNESLEKINRQQSKV